MSQCRSIGCDVRADDRRYRRSVDYLQQGAITGPKLHHNGVVRRRLEYLPVAKIAHLMRLTQMDLQPLPMICVVVHYGNEGALQCRIGQSGDPSR